MPEQPTGSDAMKSDDGPTPDTYRLQKGGEAATTRVGMEDGDDIDPPATGLDPERQSPSKR
jgi:hypothetical protein